MEMYDPFSFNMTREQHAQRGGPPTITFEKVPPSLRQELPENLRITESSRNLMIDPEKKLPIMT